MLKLHKDWRNHPRISFVQMEVTQQDLQVMMAVLRENRTEETMHVDKVGMYAK